ncbi:MAG TPA: FtsX-like permease family protein [Gammaproteobacteria bacterium]|jgi:putative ABC transport system permease protein
MQLHPILASLRHHKLTCLLLVLQVMLTAAIICNVASLIATRIGEISVVTGLQEGGLSVLDITDVAPGGDAQARHARDLALLRAIPGVQSAAAVWNSLPLGQSSYTSTTCDSQADADRAHQIRSSKVQGCSQVAIYHGGPGQLALLGLRLTAGRDFQASEYVLPGHDASNPVPAVILSSALAERLFPAQDALGKDIYVNRRTIRVVGVVDTLVKPYLHEPADDHDTMLWPMLPDGGSVMYLLRSYPKDQAEVLRQAKTALLKADPQRVFQNVQTYAELRRTYFRRDYTMIGLLLTSALGLLAVTVIGIAGLAGFWVQQRTRQIGIRRAIGATRRDVLRHFQTENFLIVGTGIVLGLGLAEALNMLLVREYGVAPLPALYFPVTALLLAALGQLAVLNPALHASRIPPATATRNL